MSVVSRSESPASGEPLPAGGRTITSDTFVGVGDGEAVSVGSTSDVDVGVGVFVGVFVGVLVGVGVFVGVFVGVAVGVGVSHSSTQTTMWLLRNVTTSSSGLLRFT